MFRLVALITFANGLINDHKYTLKKWNFYRRPTFTFTPNNHLKVLKTTIPPGLYPSDSPPHVASTPPIPLAPPCWVKPPQLHLKIIYCLDGVDQHPCHPSSPLPKEPKGGDDWSTAHPTDIQLQSTSRRGNLLPEDLRIRLPAHILQTSFCWLHNPPPAPLPPSFPPLPLGSHHLHSHSNSPHRLHVDVAALKEFIFWIHSNVRIQMRYPHTLVCFSSLWLRKELNQFHLEVGEYWNCHHPIVLFQYVFP